MKPRNLLVSVLAGVLCSSVTAHAFPVERAARPAEAFAPAAPQPAKAAADTFWFGGAHWDAVQSRWEANVSTSRTNRWTFDSGVDDDFEGWRGYDNSLVPLPTCPRPPVGTPDNSDFRWTHDSLYSLYGTPGTDLFPSATPPDTGAIWCAKYEVEADELCYSGGQGFGPNWRHEARKTFEYGGSGDTRLTFKYFSDTERNYDFTYLYLEFNSAREAAPRVTLTFALGSPASKRTKIITVSAASIPDGTTQISTVFRCTSSEWGGSGFGHTYGGFACYDFKYENLSTPANDDEDTFELGPEGWQFFQPEGIGDFVHVEDLASLPPPAAPCAALAGNVLVMSDPVGPPRHPDGQDAFALSPLIDLAELGLGNASVKLGIADAYMDLPFSNSVFYKLWLKQYPVLCQTTGQFIEAYQAPDALITYVPVPTCYDDQVFEDFSTSAPDIDYCYYALEILNLCSVSTGCTDPSGGNASPYWDNLALAVSNSGTVIGDDPAGVPKVSSLSISPNPFNPLVRLKYALAAPGKVTLRIFDVQGALVKTLVDETKTAGRYEALWNGTDDGSRRMASGVFWARYETPGSEIVKQLVLLK